MAIRRKNFLCFKLFLNICARYTQQHSAHLSLATPRMKTCWIKWPAFLVSRFQSNDSFALVTANKGACCSHWASQPKYCCCAIHTANIAASNSNCDTATVKCFLLWLLVNVALSWQTCRWIATKPLKRHHKSFLKVWNWSQVSLFVCVCVTATCFLVPFCLQSCFFRL